MTVPPFVKFIDPLLRVLQANPDGIGAAAVHEAVAQRLELSEAQKEEVIASGQRIYKNRNGWAQDRVKRAGLSESPRTGIWRLTAAGHAFLREHPGPLSDEELKAITDLSDDRQAAPWRDRLAAFRGDSAWVAERAAVNERRKEILPQILQLVQRFLSGACGLEEFKTTFDQRTRRDWDAFGAKGFGGAMFLNRLSKHAPDRAKAETELRSLLVAPANAEDAVRAIGAFVRYLDGARTSSGGTAVLPAIGRVGFLASSFWHYQNPEAWPPFYASARDVLVEDGLFEPDASGDVAADYVQFRQAFLDLGQALGLSAWDLESLLLWSKRDQSRQPDEDATDDGTEAPAPRVWLIALGRNSEHWESCYRDGVIAIGWGELGSLTAYASLEAIRVELRARRTDGKDPTNDALACWEFSREMRPGDLVYVKRGRHYIVGYGVIKGDYDFVPAHAPLPNLRAVEWRAKGEWRPREKALSLKTLTEIGHYPGLLKDIRATIADSTAEREDEVVAVAADTPAAIPYSVADADKELFLGRDRIEEILALLKYKKNIILQGPPGVGKTYVASRLAYLLIGSKDRTQIERVQFHPSYSYEDFVQGLRPHEGGGFARQDGPLLRFCKDALEDQASPYVLIIDEINRGNVSKILGELLSLIEADKRSPEYATTLAYSRDGEPPFHIPSNLHVIGMMNTADRSIALLDYALRRRFLFVDLAPAFESDGFESELVRLGAPPELRKAIRHRMRALNDEISNDPGLGRGFEIGHSYFCARADIYDDQWFSRIIDFEIVPLLREYWSDDPGKVERLATMLRGEA